MPSKTYQTLFKLLLFRKSAFEGFLNLRLRDKAGKQPLEVRT